MGNCCSSSSGEIKAETKQTTECPNCRASATPVERALLLHQIVAPLNQQLPSDDFFFCPDLNCKAVYFSSRGEIIENVHIRGEAGQKSTDANRILCYCFDISHARVIEEIEQTGRSASKAFVVEQTRLKNCACEIRNPSGRCCLRDFPK
jgi:hypothetical protein